MMIGGNLFSILPKDSKEPYWQGNNVYASVYQNSHEGVKGRYSRKQGKIEKIIYELLKERIANKDDKQKSLAIKILINTIYGIMGSPKFKNVHNVISASDVTAMARRTILYSRTVLEEHGYEVIYGDTDSCFVRDPFNDLDKLKQVTQYIVQEQKKSMNIPHDLHEFKIECLVKRMWFFKDDDGKYIKKNYIYVDEHDEITAKGLQIIKGNCSKISQVYWDTVLTKQFIDNTFTWLEPEILLIELKRIAASNPELLVKRYRVNPPNTYKIKEGDDESTALGYQLSLKYGAGEHWLVINKKIGPGKSNHYATVNMLKDKYGDDWLDAVAFEEYMKELSPFVLPEKRNKIHKVDRKRL